MTKILPKILIVDDSKTVRYQLRAMLEEAGYSVIEGSDGLEGLARLRTEKNISLVICDVNMPNLDGIEMLKRAKAEKLTNAQIFILTTEGAPELKAQAREAGATAWVTKNLDQAHFLSEVEKAVGQGKQA